MRYKNVLPATFLERPNRFIAHCLVNGAVEICHVKNTGRCREILLPGAQAFLEKSDNPNRSTEYDLIAVKKGERLINIDSQAPNKVFAEWVLGGGMGEITRLKPESVYGNSRFDFYLEKNNRKIYAEIKGVTLEENGTVLFPDAPTERGVKHIRELCQCVREGFEAVIVFVIQMENVRCFMPNDRMDPAFGRALREADRQGVQMMALDCHVTPDSMTPRNFVDIVK